MKRKLKIAILVLTHCLAFSIPIILIILSTETVEHKIKTMPTPPKTVLFSPDSSMSAGIFEANNGDVLSGDEFYLGIKIDSLEFIITRDLSEGYGTYEGGIMGIKWIDLDKIEIARIIADKPDTITFDISKMGWE